MDRADALFDEFLTELGFTGDPEMEGTAGRVAAFLRDFLPPTEPVPTPAVLPTETHDPILVRDLPYYSLCAHHLLPFFGTVTVGYVPSGRIVGLGYFPRLVRHVAQQPQLQERLAETLAGLVAQHLQPRGVLVRVTARQLCMEMRGPRSPGEVDVVATHGDPGPILPLLVGPA